MDGGGVVSHHTSGVTPHSSKLVNNKQPFSLEGNQP